MSGFSNALKLVVFAIDEFVPLGSKDRLWLVFQVCLMVGVEVPKWSYVNFILVCVCVCVKVYHYDQLSAVSPSE